MVLIHNIIVGHVLIVGQGGNGRIFQKMIKWLAYMGFIRKNIQYKKFHAKRRVINVSELGINENV